jgi:hypothetical protein
VATASRVARAQVQKTLKKKKKKKKTVFFRCPIFARQIATRNFTPFFHAISSTVETKEKNKIVISRTAHLWPPLATLCRRQRLFGSATKKRIRKI